MVAVSLKKDAPETYHGLVDPFIEKAFEPPDQAFVGDRLLVAEPGEQVAPGSGPGGVAPERALRPRADRRP